MRKTLASIFLLFLALSGAKGNDGVFYAQGNQLIPIKETDITVQKEILTINRFHKLHFRPEGELTVFQERATGPSFWKK